MSIPTGVSVPGGELAYRIGDMAPGSEDAGGGELRRPHPQHHGRRKPAPRRHSQQGGRPAQRHDGLGAGRVALRARAHGAVCARHAENRRPALQRARRSRKRPASGVIGAIDLARFEEDPDRTLYVLDVRDPGEYRAGHRPGSLNAPGGQLVQATDQWVGVRNARIVLVDDTGVRARMAGGVAAPDGPSRRLRRGRRAGRGPGNRTWHRNRCPNSPPRCRRSTSRPGCLLDSGEGTVVIDLARSIDFREGHIPGALWGVRTRLARSGRRLPPARARRAHVARRHAGASRGARGEGA